MASMGPPIIVGGDEKALARRSGGASASMGPPIIVGGDEPKKPTAGFWIQLQWGRRSSSAEMPGHQPTRPFVNGASMGPPIIVGGDYCCATCSQGGLEASMGPPIIVGGDEED